MMMPLIKKNMEEGIDLKVGGREPEVASGHPGRFTHFVFGILE